MSFIPRLSLGAVNSYALASVQYNKSSFLFSRWKKRSKNVFQLTSSAGKHGAPSNSTASGEACRDDISPAEVRNSPARQSVTFVRFQDMLNARREQARRSLVVQVHSDVSCSELRHYCEGISPVNQMFHYKLKENHYVLVEFKENCLPEILEKWCIAPDKSSVPVASPVVWFKAAASGKKHRQFAEPENEDVQKVTKVPPPPPYEDILSLTAQSRDVSDMMMTLYDSTKLDELGARLRFFSARQLELAMSGLFPHCAVLPFGSSVNGFGKAGSDLDLIFRHEYSEFSDSVKVRPSQKHLRLVYQTKTSLGGPRPLTQRQMELLGDLLQVLMPGCSGVKRILQARVPIVKYSNDFTGLDCDLSMSNMTGLYMSELLFLYSQLDPQSKLLICFVKHWAAAALLTNPTPGRWVTNFMLIMLSIHYLQTLKRIPPLDLMVKAASDDDQRVTEDINCTFVRDLNSFDWKPASSSASPAKLLRGFFDYYMNFDFGTSCISITTDARLSKPDYSPLYIVNPLERSLNVAKNVSGEELEKLRMAMRNAAWALESEEMPVNALLTRLGQTRDALSSVLHPPIYRRYNPPRMVTVKELFRES
ncbi:Cid1 family poly A polymerase [Nesidiocoris tenuis]|uniref:Cid1 family poly A polymerase n=1 Tax=Nesidiocoris tenuis TaxID=355587 RepID=A0ABN7B0A2_9HEMI|nr:Cid1 family poly A polymerase [Nesidiocoris tenuis]